jgi:salicylate hydroxylase
MQDGWLLAQILQFYQGASSISPDDKRALLRSTLEAFNSIRSPYYAQMYDHLDKPKSNIYGMGTTLSSDPAGSLYWIYGLDIGAQWQDIKERLRQEAKIGSNLLSENKTEVSAY